ncbi:DUF6578 domain-containing protein [Microbacterium sp. P03]|uniref:DUF6578 domain-containing protein n=1 Tax=Microbacterium sp. P03 TaxID=3366946 RepID=UPI00374514D6
MSAITRIWLADWEWQCCGEAFAVGDDIDFGIATRSPHLALADTLGPVLVATVDAIESHHEDDFVDRVRGRVLQVHAVTREVVERRSLRRPPEAPAERDRACNRRTHCDVRRPRRAAPDVACAEAAKGTQPKISVKMFTIASSRSCAMNRITA